MYINKARKSEINLKEINSCLKKDLCISIERKATQTNTMREHPDCGRQGREAYSIPPIEGNAMEAIFFLCANLRLEEGG